MLFPQETLYYVASVVLAVVGFFLCWLLYEAARLLRQTNEAVTDAREKILRLEKFAEHVSERMSSVSQYLSLIAASGKQVYQWIQKRQGLDEDDDTWPEMTKSKKRRK